MIRRFISAAIVLSAFASSVYAKDFYLPVTGSVGVFRTDARIVNPSGTKDITIVATFEPVSAAASVGTRTASITIPKRQQRVLDDVVGALFPGVSVLGAIRLSSDDDFIATARIYATVTGGTAGQGYTAIDATQAKTKGVLQQLKSTGSGPGTSRSNLGFVNPGATAAAVTLRLYDKNSAKVSEQALTIPGRSSLSPANYFASVAGADFSDAWASYTSDVAIIAYASIIDNGTTDPTFLPAVEDTGSDPVVVVPTTKTFDITARQFEFVASGPGATGSEIRVKVGDRVKLRFISVDVTHGVAIESNLFGGAILARNAPKEFEFTVDRAGTFTFFCTVSSCGSGHGSMEGRLIVTP